MSTPVLELGPARVIEAPHLAEMSRDLIERGLTWRWRAAAIARHIRSAHSEVVVARTGPRIDGFGILEFETQRIIETGPATLEENSHLVLLAVADHARRNGLGRRLVEYLEQMARTAGIGEIRLEVRASNVGARRFYERLGYRAVALLRGYYESRESAVRMARRLRGS